MNISINFRTKHELHQAGSVSQVNKYNTAVVTPLIGPAGDFYL
jgi:hypothetical protein